MKLFNRFLCGFAAGWFATVAWHAGTHRFTHEDFFFTCLTMNFLALKFAIEAVSERKVRA